MNTFVGRIDELAALAQIADVAIRGEAAAAIVVGDPGSGKSRLLGEAAARTDLPNRFRVVGFEPESEVPLAAASELLRALATAMFGVLVVTTLTLVLGYGLVNPNSLAERFRRVRRAPATTSVRGSAGN
jgi:predicted ATPase